MRRRLVPAAVVALCLVTLASCGGGREPSSSPSAAASGSTATTGPTASLPATATAVESDRPSVSISSPADGASIAGDSVTVTLEVQRFEVVNKIGDKNKDGEGHVHFYLDVEEIPTTPAQEATVTGEGRYVARPETSHTWSDLAPGRHKLGAQLVQNNHTPLQPPATVEITVTIGGG